MSDAPKRTKLHRKPRDIQVLTEAVKGKSETAIAKDLGINRRTVHKILTSDETKSLIKESEDRIKRLLTKSIDVVEKALDNHVDPESMNHSLKAALAVLKSHGVIRETVNMEHSFPKPTVIERIEGGAMILTAKQEDEE